MKKNILTIIMMAIVLINTILTAVLIFVIVPTSNKTNQLISKVASIVDLELGAPEGGELSVADISTYDVPDKLTINLQSKDSNPHYALLYVSLSMNTTHEDYEDLNPKVAENVNAIKEIVTEEFGKYTIDEVNTEKDAIKEAILTRIQELFQSDFIINVSFGNMVLS